MLYTALLLGFVGSLHCVGMCGPLVLMLPADTHHIGKYFLGRVLYNIGRILMYGFIGLLIGFIGEQLSFFFSQKWLSAIIGVLILIVVLLPARLQQKLEIYSSIAQLTSFVKRSFAKLYKQNRFFTQFLFGLVNGLLPCGLVYAALAGAFLQPKALDGGLYMLLFGIGTIPMMLSVSLGAGWIRKLLGNKVQRLIPITYGLVAIWLIMRGFNISIPNLYTAPDVNNIPECHTPATDIKPMKN